MIASNNSDYRFSILWHSVPSDTKPGNEGESLIPRQTTLVAIPPQKPNVSHFDLMIQYGGVLRTWELLYLPVEGEDTKVRRLDDHRLEYLDYEGPLSHNRGHVIGWERGKAIWQRSEEPELDFLLFGSRLTAKLRLTAPSVIKSTDRNAPLDSGELWTLSAEIWQLQSCSKE